jgi:hypothetical protein
MNAMLSNGSKNNCPFEHEIVSYIYDEMHGSERLKFETHLSDCSICTDDFAAVSDARFSMFEWRKEEFAQLATPKIVIPYESKKIIKQAAPVGLIASVQSWISFVNLSVAAAAGVIVVFALSFVIFRYQGRSEQLTVSRAVVPQSDSPTKEAHNQIDEPAIKKNEFAVATAVKSSSNKINRVVKVAAFRQPVSVKRTIAKNAVKQTTVVPPAAPVLNSYEANDDDSLRLADLLADIDG